ASVMTASRPLPKAASWCGSSARGRRPPRLDRSRWVPVRPWPRSCERSATCRKATFAGSGPRGYRLRAMRRRVLLLIGLSPLIAGGRDALPPEITIEQVVMELAPPLAEGARVDEPAAGAVRRAVLEPGEGAAGGAPVHAPGA